MPDASGTIDPAQPGPEPNAGSPYVDLLTVCEGHYRQLQQACGDVLNATFAADAAHFQAASHGFAVDLAKWLEVLEGRPEADLLKAALREYQFALLAVVQGQYGQAFMALRLAFELLLGAVQFSGNEFQLRVWLAGQRDLSWEALVNTDNGVFSTVFVRAFCEELADSGPRYGALARQVYRECSEFVHGNAHTHTLLPAQVVFSPEAFEAWHSKAKSVALAASFALCARYLRFLDGAALHSLEPILLDRLGHLAAVRSFLGAPVEPSNV